MTFIKKKEDFVCENCKEEVSGNGYTNHCSFCLYSKHVDISPGDRKAGCGGLMEPISIEVEGQEYSIIHKCVICSHTKKNKISSKDNFDKVLDLAKKRVQGEMGSI
jgi:hypothetical protein